MARRPRRSSSATGRLDAPRENAPRGTFRVAAARRALAMQHPNLLTQSAVSDARRSSPAPVIASMQQPSRGVVTQPKAVAAVAVSPKPVATATVASVVHGQHSNSRSADRRPNEPDKPERRDDPTCKARPSSNRGSGKGRPFVPWCK